MQIGAAIAAIVALQGCATSAPPPSSTVRASAVTAPVTALKPDAAFAHYPRYVGTLGGRRIVLRIGPKPDDPDELNGEYQYLQDGRVIVIAGARDGNTLTLEESDDGTRISGQWVGFYDGAGGDSHLSGQRLNVDGSGGTAFDLHAEVTGSDAPHAVPPR